MENGWMKFLPLMLILAATVAVLGIKLYRIMSEEMRLKISVMLLATGSIAALSTILLIKPVGMITVVGSLVDPSNDFVMLPFVIAAVAVVNLIGNHIHKGA